MSSSKRKRDEETYVDWCDDNGGFIDDDSEPHKFGTSVLPVANLPNSFQDVPQNGMEYLFTVRREERRLPLVTRVPNPYAVPEKKQRSSSMDGSGASNPSMNVIPSEEWRTCFEERFRNFRANLRQPTIHISLPSLPGTCRIPEMRDRDRWWAFFRGDTEWENIPRSLLHGNKSGEKHNKVVADYEESLPQEESMRSWVVYEEKLSWDQADEGEVVELSSGGDTYTETVEFGDENAEGDNLGEEILSGESNDKEKVEGVTPTPHHDSLTPTLAVNEHVAVPDTREPTPHILSRLDQKTTFHLLKYFLQWIRCHFDRSLLPSPPPPPVFHTDPPSHRSHSYDLTSCHGRWMFALLSRLDAQLTSDEISVLRKLARECVRLIKEERSSQSTRSEKSTMAPCMGENACWMIVAAIAGVWGQKDLWVDAADILQ